MVMDEFFAGWEHSRVFHTYTGWGFLFLGSICLITAAYSITKTHKVMDIVEAADVWYSCECKKSVLTHLSRISWTLSLMMCAVSWSLLYSWGEGWNLLSHETHIFHYCILFVFIGMIGWSIASRKHFLKLMTCNNYKNDEGEVEIMFNRTNQMDFLKSKPNSYLIKYDDLLEDPDGMKYVSRHEYWFLTRYGWVRIPEGMRIDGATGVPDNRSNSPWTHDRVCNTGTLENGTKLSNWQASMIFFDILWAEAQYFLHHGSRLKYMVRKSEAILGFIGTFIGGGGEARSNGMFKVKEPS